MKLARVSTWVTAFMLAVLCAGPTQADYQAGQQAWEDGRPGEALVQWQAAADAGDRRAMLALGRLYVRGLGVPQDYVEAHKWLNLAAARGDRDALKERDALAESMTSDERAEARKLAREWQPRGTAEPIREPSVAMVQPPDTSPPPPEAIAEAQRLLSNLGYRPGPADGLWGKRTGGAYRAFLRDAGLPEAQMLTPEALHAMRELAGRGTQAESRPAPARTTSRTLSEADAVGSETVPPEALHRAAQAGDINVLKTTLASGVDVNARDASGWTALMHAVNKGYPLLVDRLLESGADSEIRAADGATALFIAALHGSAEIFARLLGAGADASVQGPRGMTPLEVAQVQGHARVLALPEVVALKEAQAREEEARRVDEDAEAFARARALNTTQAYVAYLSAWCPQGNNCASARAGIDALFRARIAGRTFAGTSSMSDPLSIQFLPSGKVISQYGRGNFFSGCKRLGTWHVEDGKVVINCRCKGHSYSVAHAVFDNDVLVGNEEVTLDNWLYRGQKHVFTWRLRERLQKDSATESRAATRRQGQDR